MLSCTGLFVSYENGTVSGGARAKWDSLRGSGVPRFALNDVTLEFAPGEVTGIAGCSGSGKSTLLKCLAGLLLPTSGICCVDGELFGSTQGDEGDTTTNNATSSSCQNARPDDVDSRGIASRAYRERVGLVSQLPEEQLFARTVREEVAFGPGNLGLGQEEIERRMTWALEAVGLAPEHFADRNPFTLSGGEARRVAIADILALRPRYLLLDEPTAGLDPREAKRLLSLVSQLAQEGMGVVIVSHDLDALSRCCSYAVLLHQGEVVGKGRARDVLGDAALVRCAGLTPSAEVELADRLRHRGVEVPQGVLTANEIASAINNQGQRHPCVVAPLASAYTYRADAQKQGSVASAVTHRAETPKQGSIATTDTQGIAPKRQGSVASADPQRPEPQKQGRAARRKRDEPSAGDKR